MIAGVPVHRFPVSPGRDQERWWQLHVAIGSGEPVDYARQLEWMGNSVWSRGAPARRRGPPALRLDRRDAVPVRHHLLGRRRRGLSAPPSFPASTTSPTPGCGRCRQLLSSARGCMVNSPRRARAAGAAGPRGHGGAWWASGYDDEPPPPGAVAAFLLSAGHCPGLPALRGSSRGGQGAAGALRSLRRVPARSPRRAGAGPHGERGPADPRRDRRRGHRPGLRAGRRAFGGLCGRQRPAAPLAPGEPSAWSCWRPGWRDAGAGERRDPRAARALPRVGRGSLVRRAGGVPRGASH